MKITDWNMFWTAFGASSNCGIMADQTFTLRKGIFGKTTAMKPCNLCGTGVTSWQEFGVQ